MKDEYLNKLKEQLTLKGVSDVDKIVEKYTIRYEFGLEAGMSEDEIEAKFGTVEDIILQYENKNMNNDKPATFDLEINLPTADDIRIYEKAIDHVRYEADLYDPDNYIFDFDVKDHLYIKYKTDKYRGKRASGQINIEVPLGFKFNKININIINGDHEFGNINAESFAIHLVSADLKIGKIKTNLLEINCVSADMEAESLIANKANITTVSGDMEIMSLESSTTNISTESGDVDIENDNSLSLTLKSVSGDVNVQNTTCNDITSSSLSGDIIINGIKYKGKWGK